MLNLEVFILIIFLVSSAMIFAFFRQRISFFYAEKAEEVSSLEDTLDKLSEQEKKARQINSQKETSVSNTVSLYELTREISEFLEDSKIIDSFQKGLRKFIHCSDCYYLDGVNVDSDLGNCEIVPLASGTDNFGYLVIKGLNEKDRWLLDVLTIQLISNIKRARLYKLVQRLSITDSLTHVYTRVYTMDRFEEELRRSVDLHLALSFLMIDLDNFKPLNDTYGHLVGDVALKKVADIIKLNCREIDLIGRFGGEEFMVVLPMTTKEGAIFAAERIRKSIEAEKVKAFDEVLNVAVSVGVSSFPKDAKTTQELIDKADWALYRSKRTGKNKISAFGLFKIDDNILDNPPPQ